MKAMLYGPYILTIAIVVMAIFFFVIKWILSKKTNVERSMIYSKVPIVSKLYIDYMTSFLAREWGKLFEQGLEMKDIVFLMKELKSYPLLTELSEQMESQLIQGIAFNEQVEQWTFVKKEFGLMIRQGEVKSKLGTELLLFSNLCWNNLTFKLEKMMGIIQPAVFLFVGAMILSIYAAIVLPIYDSMGEIK
jgi:competence protein ComGB